jgi:serine-type D-Ala-D-Ala carboxypeptidase (penicillin-binding protein 5/6)
MGPLSAVKPVEDFDMADLLSVSSIPTKIDMASQPVPDAKAALLMDMGTGMVLYQKNAYARLPMASLTKIMTAIIILENHSLDEIVTVKDDFNGTDLGVKMWLRQYEKMTVENLLISLLVPSAGDAAMALAEYHSGSVEKFVKAMNEKAKMLNLRDTHFVNPVGLDDPDHYSSAYDLALLTKFALRNKDFRRIVQIPGATVTSVDGKTSHSFEGTNYLLDSYLDIRGVKTGTTDAAGESLINLARNSDGAEVIVVLLNSPDRFQESKRLLDWSFRNFKW